MPVFRTLFALLALTVAVMAVAALDRPHQIGPADAEAAALNWVGTGFAQEPRRDGDEWEVDVVRPDGSLVEVTVGRGRELLGFDEERGPRGGPAPDDLRGARPARAVRAALAASGPGRVLDVERESESGGGIEIGVRRPDGTKVEVGLDIDLRVVAVEREDPADE